MARSIRQEAVRLLRQIVNDHQYATCDASYPNMSEADEFLVALDGFMEMTGLTEDSDRLDGFELERITENHYGN